MTKRVKQHQLEDLSRAKYQLAIPCNWVFRDKDKDYGIDAEVEIFNKNGKATGLVYWVQLKATDSKSEAAARKLDLSIKSIEYYKELEIPVLIVRYSKAHDCFYCKWAQDIDLYYAKNNAKTFRINFSEDEKFDASAPEKVKIYLSKIKYIKNIGVKLPISFSFIAKDNIVNKIPRSVLVSSLRTALREFSDFVVLKGEPEDSLLLATLSGDVLTIRLSNIAGCTFHSIKKIKCENLAEYLVVSILFGFAIALSRIGQFESMSRILLSKKIKDRLFMNQKIFSELFPLILRTSFFNEALDAASEAIVDEEDNFLEIFATIVSLFESGRDEEKLKAIEHFLHKCLEKYLKIGVNSQIGICHYNLGNHYRSRRKNEYCKKAIYHYLMARKYEDKYLEQSYYYHELGGILFLHEKYCFSAAMYNNAIKKGATETTKPLYADALMFSGNYQAAVDVFTEYLGNSSGDKDDEWHLKLICLETLIQNKGVKKQTRYKKEALKLVDTTKTGDSFLESLQNAIELDMLCGLAWFNLGIEHTKRGLAEKAVWDFTFCGLCQTWDIQALVNAILCCFNKKSPIAILPLIFRTAYFFNGDEFLKKLYSEFKDKFDSVIYEELSNAIEELLPKNNSRDERPAVRFLGNDGKFHNIFESKSPKKGAN